MKRLTRIAALGAAALLALTGCAASGQPAGGEASIRVANIPAGLGAAVALGIEGDEYEDAGLAITNKIFSAENDAIDAVLGGQSDVAVASTFGAITRLQSNRLVIVSSLAISPPGWHKFAVADDIADPEKLAGKKVGYVAGTSEQWVTDEYLEHIGLDDGDVELVSFNALFDLVTALQTGDVDAGWIWGDGVDQIEKGDGVSVRFDDSVVYPGTNALLVTTRDYAEKNEKLLADFLTATEKVNERIPQDVEGSAAIAAKATGGTDASFVRAFSNNEYRVDLTSKDLDTISSLAEWAVSSGSFDIPEPIETYLDVKALQKAFPDRGEGGSAE